MLIRFGLVDIPFIFCGSGVQIEELLGGVPCELLVSLFELLDDAMAAVDLRPQGLLGAIVALDPAVFPLDLVVGGLEVVDFAVSAVELLPDQLLVEAADQFVQTDSVV